MKLNLFTRTDCDFCKMVKIPESLEVNQIDIDKDYSGFRPANVPVLQLGTLNLEGPEVINIILQAIHEN